MDADYNHTIELPEPAVTEVPLAPPAPPGGRHRRSWIAIVVAGAVILVAGAFLGGRITTNGERAALAEQVDDADGARADLEAQVGDLEDQVQRATDRRVEQQTLIEELQADAATVAAELVEARADKVAAIRRIAELADAEATLSESLDGVLVCSQVAEHADATLAAWEQMVDAYDEYLATPPGSPEEADAIDRLDNAWLAIDDARSDYIASKARCEAAFENIPECDVDPSIHPDPVRPFTSDTSACP